MNSWPPFEAFLSNTYFLFSLFAIVSSPSIIGRCDWSWYSHVIIICKKVCIIGKNRLIFYYSFVGILGTHTETTCESHGYLFQSWRLCTLLLQLHAVTDCHFSAGFNVFLIHRNLYAPVPSPTFVYQSLRTVQITEENFFLQKVGIWILAKHKEIYLSFCTFEKWWVRSSFIVCCA